MSEKQLVLAQVSVTSPNATESQKGLNESKTITVGRNNGQTFKVKDPTVSGRHLEIKFDKSKGCWVVKDVGSSNGTFYKGRRITSSIALTTPGTHDFEIGHNTEVRLRIMNR